jgi:hypothetical protein
MSAPLASKAQPGEGGRVGYGPPGLWLAVSKIPPVAFILRMTWLAAGVLRIPFCPYTNFLTPYAAPIWAINCITSEL